MKPIPLTRPATPEPLQRFGKSYYLVRTLAEGGMAELFLAKQVGAEGFERDVVIKRMLPHLSRHQEFVEMFLDEARLAARLFHPNIVQITDLGSAEGSYFLCMEYLPGEDLEALIAAASRRGEPVPVGVATRIVLSACEGLEFAHGYHEGGRAVNLVHRDVSPSNVLVTYQGTVKVVDFGIAKASSRLGQTQPGMLKGKLGYMSPEQARSEPLDGRSDLFSLGVTFYELLTGQRVFLRDTELGVLLALMERPVPPVRSLRPDVPEALERIVMRALERNREQRYQSATELRADLESFLAGCSSVPGSTQVAQYLRSLFGEEQARSRTQLPRLEELRASGVMPAPPEREDFGDAPTLVRKPAPEGRSTPQAPVAHGGAGLRGAALGALGAVLVLGAGAAALLMAKPHLLAGTQAPAPTSPLPLGEGQGEGVVQPGDAVTEQSPAAADEAPPAAEAKAPAVTAEAPVAASEGNTTAETTPSDAKAASKQDTSPKVLPATVNRSTDRETRTVELTQTLVKRTFRRHSTSIIACAKAHETELPADGAVHMEFTIRNSGRVEQVGPAETSKSLASTALVQCLQDAL
ncbi:MAG: protein kinase, partial [Myxococcaceae bacterium]|nr:protein kinase [Myxococcaceae bacterium]